jgi:hypothetical protein
MKKLIFTVFISLYMVTAGFSQVNLVVNGGFENWTAGLPDDWELKTADITMIQENTIVHSGNYSAKVEFTSTSTQRIGQTVSVSGDVLYTFNIWVLDNDPAARFRIWGYWNLSGGGSVTLDPGNLYTTDDPSWQLYTYQTTSPTDAISLDFEMRFYDVAPFPGLGTIYIDDVEILGPSSGAPLITNVSYEPFPANQTIDITCDVTVSTGAVDSVALYYYTDFNSASVDSMPMSLVSGDQYMASLPGFNNGTSFAYWVKAWGNGTSTSTGENKVIIGIPDIGIFHTQLDANGLPLASGYLTRLKGIVTVASGVFSTTDYDFYMQDNTGGVNVFEFNIGATQYFEGDELEVLGTIDTYNGKVEISNFDATVLSTGNPLPAPIDVNIEDMGEAYEGRLITIDNVSLAAGSDPWPTTQASTNLTITDGTGEMVMRIVDSTHIGGNPEPNWPITVVGIGNQFDTSAPYFEGFEIQPRSYSDFAITGIDDNPMVVYSYSLGQNYPNPFNPETIIPYTLQKAGKVNLRVFNILGQVVYSFSQKQSAGEHTLTFDGRRFSSGIYFYQLEAGNFRSVRKMILTK